jgi:DNA/RNA-binding domain of Phe-tRNA-synthetase-like protein
MKFMIEEKVFEVLPQVCFGVVVARETDNNRKSAEITEFLKVAVESTLGKFRSVKPKDHPDLQPYREAFQKMQINPNKFPCSVEALTNRIIKGGNLPDINPAVNLVNACSLKYTLPMGAHDLDSTDGDLAVRFSRKGDRFIPFGEKEPEILDDGELVYAAGNTIKTRKWIWRQSDRGKVTSESKNIFFPIDGFTDYNQQAVLAASQELAGYLEDILGAKTTKHFLDVNNRAVNL